MPEILFIRNSKLNYLDLSRNTIRYNDSLLVFYVVMLFGLTIIIGNCLTQNFTFYFNNEVAAEGCFSGKQY